MALSALSSVEMEGRSRHSALIWLVNALTFHHAAAGGNASRRCIIHITTSIIILFFSGRRGRPWDVGEFRVLKLLAKRCQRGPPEVSLIALHSGTSRVKQKKVLTYKPKILNSDTSHTAVLPTTFVEQREQRLTFEAPGRNRPPCCPAASVSSYLILRVSSIGV